MKKNLFIKCAVLFLTIFTASCKDNSVFTLSGTINDPENVKKIFLLEADSLRVNVVDSTTLSDGGKFQFKHHAPYPNMYKIRIGGSIFDFIAKNGDAIEFSADLNDKSHTYQVTGSQESEKIKEFNKLSNFYGEKNSRLNEEYEAKSQALGKQSDSLIQIYMPMFQKNVSDYSEAVIKFVNDNKNSLAGFYAATSLDPYKYERQMIAYADEIKDSFKDNPNVGRFVKQMMDIKPISVGHKAPEFTVSGINDNPIKLSDYTGKYVMLDFWASWCGPCRHENPNVVKQYNIYKDKGFNILGISLDTSQTNWQQAILADKLTWSHGSDLKSFDGPLERLYHIEAIPSNFIIDPQGTIIAKNVTGRDLEEFLKKTFSKPQ